MIYDKEILNGIHWFSLIVKRISKKLRPLGL